MMGRRTLLSGVASGGLVSVLPRLAAAAGPTVRVGVLRFGTVAWELDVIRRHQFDQAGAMGVEPVEFATAQATQIALQSGAVDLIVVDWFWVSRQRAAGADWTFVPFSTAIGALVVPAGSPVHSVADLAGRRLGIAGSPLDKSWLILKAYAKENAGIDLETASDKVFGAPPLLAETLAAGRLDAVLTFWQFAAKAEAAGMRRVLSVQDALHGLGFERDVPMIGYVFSERWAERNRPAMESFLDASRRARDVLATADDEWQLLAPLTGAGTPGELAMLRDRYREGIPRHWTHADQDDARRLYELLARIGGPALVGSEATLAPGTFWQSAVL